MWKKYSRLNGNIEPTQTQVCHVEKQEWVLIVKSFYKFSLSHFK